MRTALSSIHAHVSQFAYKICTSRRGFWTCVALITVIKVTLATASLLGPDYVSYLSDAVANAGAFSWSPWLLLTHKIYSFWLWLPLDHGNIPRALRVSSSPLLPSYYLLTILIKGPLIAADMLSAFLVYQLGRRLNGKWVGRKASLLWLGNPLAILFIEMWGSIEIITIFFTLVGVDLILNGHYRSGASSFAAGIIVKASPIVAGVAGLIWVIRKKAGKANALMLLVAIAFGTLAYFYWFSQGQVEAVTGFLTDPAPYFALNTEVIQSFSQYAPLESYLGFGTIGLAFFWIIAGEIWPSADRAFIALLLTSNLLIYSLASWLPTAFLWAVPLMILWDPCAEDRRYYYVFCCLVLVYTMTLDADLLTSSGHSFLSVPYGFVPGASTLVKFIIQFGQLSSSLFAVQIRSIFVAFSFFYSAVVIWKSLRGGG
jgi:hypothetical protein